MRKQDAAGVAQFVIYIVAGRTFGEMAAIDGENHFVSCTATDACVLPLLPLLPLLPKAQFERIFMVNEALS